MPKREHAKGCPGRLYGKFAREDGPLIPARPPRCPCLWSDFTIARNFRFLMESDTDLALSLWRLLKLFP